VVALCDDVITTGSTAREAQRALAAVGIEVGLVVTVAATRKRMTDVLRRAESA
jgi:predicted amidophosphoribosyltransferase